MRLHFLSHHRLKTKASALIRIYGQSSIETCDVIIVLGGDGFMLKSLNTYGHYQKPFYGINYGTVGFLMNTAVQEDLKKILTTTKTLAIHPMVVTMKEENGQTLQTTAINEVTLFRKRYRALAFSYRTQQHHGNVMGDGCIVATALGSTAYNASAGGLRIPISDASFVVTMINPYTSLQEKSFCIPDTQEVALKVLSPKTRPAYVGIDHQDYRQPITDLLVKKDPHTVLRLLFSDPKTFF